MSEACASLHVESMDAEVASMPGCVCKEPEWLLGLPVAPYMPTATSTLEPLLCKPAVGLLKSLGLLSLCCS